MKNKSVLIIVLLFAGITLLFFLLNRTLENDYNQRKREVEEMEKNFIKMNEKLNKEANKIELPFYRIPQDAFDWIFEDYGSPYYFVLHPGLTVSHIYVPDRTFPGLNKAYIESVKQFFSRLNKAFLKAYCPIFFLNYRENSRDSRAFGWVAERLIVGKINLGELTEKNN